MKKINDIKYMTRLEVADAVRKYPVAILPLGATEQHGHHLPLGTDIFLAEGIARKVAEETGALLLPSVPYGYSWVWRNIPGTISLQQHHVEAVIKDVAHSVERYGIKLLVVINGHDANNASMKYATRELADETSVKVVYLFYPDLEKVMKTYCESNTWYGMIHACEFETSLLLSLHPEYVQMDKAVKEYPERPLLYGKSSISLGDLSKTGVFGDPTRANKEKGNKMINEFVQKMVKLIQLVFQEN